VDLTPHYLVTRTRYGGFYEGGRWAAFSILGLDGAAAAPSEAFSGDAVASEWWWSGPSVPVGVGDTATEALASLLHKISRPDEPRFPIGCEVNVRKAPDFWFHEGTGIVTKTIQEPRLGQYAPPGATEWEYVLAFEDGAEIKVPEAYVRLGPASPADA
jgi:hypothetical protein